MTANDDHPVSEQRIVSARDQRGHIEFALNQVGLYLARMDPSPTTRRLELALEGFRLTVDSWSTRNPTDEQLDHIREQVDQVLRLVVSVSPTVRLGRRA
jgi:hypothetical protein